MSTTSPSPPSAPARSIQPNVYELHHKALRVVYTTNGVDGKARLTYQDDKEDRSFTGDEIRVQSTEIGDVVTVTLDVVPDLGATTFSFLVPAMNIHKEGHVVTEAIYTQHRTSIGGPQLVRGQVQRYKAEILVGTARYVVF